ncbi:hypothetical protein ACFPRL_27970 [Pseudoclavibacter helvolus]
MNPRCVAVSRGHYILCSLRLPPLDAVLQPCSSPQVLHRKCPSFRRFSTDFRRLCTACPQPPRFCVQGVRLSAL